MHAYKVRRIARKSKCFWCHLSPAAHFAYKGKRWSQHDQGPWEPVEWEHVRGFTRPEDGYQCQNFSQSSLSCGFHALGVFNVAGQQAVPGDICGTLCWEAKRAMLRHAAGVPEDHAVHKRGIVERELLLLGLLPPSFVVLHVVLSVIL